MERRVGENEPICTEMTHQSFSKVDITLNNLGVQTVSQILLPQHHWWSDSMQQNPDWPTCHTQAQLYFSEKKNISANPNIGKWEIERLDNLLL